MNAAMKALILAALDEERQRMGAVRGPLFRAAEKLEAETPQFTKEEITDIFRWLESVNPSAFNDAHCEFR